MNPSLQPQMLYGLIFFKKGMKFAHSNRLLNITGVKQSEYSEEFLNFRVKLQTHPKETFCVEINSLTVDFSFFFFLMNPSKLN